MQIAIFSKATRETRSGNWITASRWRKLLRSAGYRVAIVHDESEIETCSADLLIGLHARRSAKALRIFKRVNPGGSTMVAMTGTDIYRDLSPSRKRQSAAATRSLDDCDRIILLQPLMAKRLRTAWRAKSSVVMMDASKVKAPAKRTVKSTLGACVVGHLRYEKDPLRAAMAVRKLPRDVSIEVTHAGGALSDSFQVRAERELSQNENWNWLRSVEYAKVQQLMRNSDVLVNSSRSEGAPNVLFEAIGWRLPIIASRIDGHVGVLGADYRGYFKVGDTDGLQKLLVRCARDEAFYRQLVTAVEKLARKYQPGNELKMLQKAIGDVK